MHPAEFKNPKKSGVIPLSRSGRRLYHFHPTPPLPAFPRFLFHEMTADLQTAHVQRHSADRGANWQGKCLKWNCQGGNVAVQTVWVNVREELSVEENNGVTSGKVSILQVSAWSSYDWCHFCAVFC